MCGIVGYIGKQQASAILLDGLQRLEYRGYDSAGVAVLSPQNQLQVKKSIGRLKVLREMLHDGADLEGTIGLGHTRWATHGEPSDLNAHPHVSGSGRFAVIHNGIIENYLEIKEFLQSRGEVFVSETDTEVVAHLLEYYYRQNGSFLESVNQVLQRIEGAYALGMICADMPDCIIATRKDAPLLLGFSEEGSFLASDATALIRYTRDVVYLEDGDVAVLRKDGIQIFDSLGAEVQKPHHHIEWDISAAEKGGYEHFMLKEIMEQPEAIRKTLQPRMPHGSIQFEELPLTAEQLAAFRNIYIVACGSSYHVGMVGKYVLQKLLHKNIELQLASEFRYSEPLVDEHSLVIVISQSGETLDSMAALREAKKHGSFVLSIVNVVGSSIARESDAVLYTWAGPEIAVATTKAYSTQLALLLLFGVWAAEQLGTISEAERQEILEAFQQIPAQEEQVLSQARDIQYLASRYFNHSSVFFIGRNLDYAMGMEGSLKLKEISYIHSEAYASGELKHGTISLIEKGTLVIALGTYEALFDKAMSNVVEVRSRGADVLAVTTENRRAEMEKNSSAVLTVPKTHPYLQPLLGILPLQLFAYYVALQRGCDIDKPRNLAKSVTVE